jgi:hypothetical protein
MEHIKFLFFRNMIYTSVPFQSPPPPTPVVTLLGQWKPAGLALSPLRF